jgi:hypothetical protein
MSWSARMTFPHTSGGSQDRPGESVAVPPFPRDLLPRSRPRRGTMRPQPRHGNQVTPDSRWCRPPTRPPTHPAMRTTAAPRLAAHYRVTVRTIRRWGIGARTGPRVVPGEDRRPLPRGALAAGGRPPRRVHPADRLPKPPPGGCCPTAAGPSNTVRPVTDHKSLLAELGDVQGRLDELTRRLRELAEQARLSQRAAAQRSPLQPLPGA